jgi:Flp pilus assembly pilin Flp
VTALVLGILSLVMCGLFTGIPAMVMGRRVTREVRASGGTLGGEGFGQAAFWTGLVGTCLSCLSVLLVVGVFAFGGVVSNTFETTCTQVDSNGQQTPC